jgi:hypothetical protein
VWSVTGLSLDGVLVVVAVLSALGISAEKMYQIKNRDNEISVINVTSGVGRIELVFVTFLGLGVVARIPVCLAKISIHLIFNWKRGY